LSVINTNSKQRIDYDSNRVTGVCPVARVEKRSRNMDSKTKINLLIAAVACLTISLIVGGVVVVVVVRGQGDSKQVIQEAAEKSVTDMAAAMKKNALEAEARAEERKKVEEKEKESADRMKRISEIVENATKK